jgi:hypothetical protein
MVGRQLVVSISHECCAGGEAALAGALVLRRLRVADILDWNADLTRRVAEYLDEGARFYALSLGTSDLTLKKRYADMAECYRLLAADLQRLMKDGRIEDESH